MFSSCLSIQMMFCFVSASAKPLDLFFLFSFSCWDTSSSSSSFCCFILFYLPSHVRDFISAFYRTPLFINWSSCLQIALFPTFLCLKLEFSYSKDFTFCTLKDIFKTKCIFLLIILQRYLFNNILLAHFEFKNAVEGRLGSDSMSSSFIEKVHIPATILYYHKATQTYRVFKRGRS